MGKIQEFSEKSKQNKSRKMAKIDKHGAYTVCSTLFIKNKFKKKELALWEHYLIC
jgi:hypothetical protein